MITSNWFQFLDYSKKLLLGVPSPPNLELIAQLFIDETFASGWFYYYQIFQNSDKQWIIAFHKLSIKMAGEQRRKLGVVNFEPEIESGQGYIYDLEKDYFEELIKRVLNMKYFNDGSITLDGVPKELKIDKRIFKWNSTSQFSALNDFEYFLKRFKS